jgi:hypothetical protein
MSSFRVTLAVGALLSTATLVYAGMPSVRFVDAARLRLESISFVLVGFLVSAGLI